MLQDLAEYIAWCCGEGARNPNLGHENWVGHLNFYVEVTAPLCFRPVLPHPPIRWGGRCWRCTRHGRTRCAQAEVGVV